MVAAALKAKAAGYMNADQRLLVEAIVAGGAVIAAAFAAKAAGKTDEDQEQAYL